MNQLAMFGLALWGINLSLLVLGTFFLFRHFRKSKSEPLSTTGISILKPMKGVDPGLFENLESFFQLKDDNFEILFSIADEMDLAIPLVRRLIEKYPSVDAKIIIGNQFNGINPKVNNLVKTYDDAKNDWILISDSNIRINENYLTFLRKEMTQDTGVITAIITGQNAQGFGGRLESIYLNTFYARWMILASKFGSPCVLGKSMLFRKSVLNRLGGIKAFGCYLAEDYMAGKAVQKIGYKVKILAVPVQQFIGDYQVKVFWSRHLRWGRIRKAQALFAFIGEGLQNCLISGLIGAFAFSQFEIVSLAKFLTLHTFIWGVSDMCIVWKIDRRPNIQTIFFWLLRELSAFPLWLQSIGSNHVNWRGQQLRIMKGGLLESSTTV